MTWPYLATMWLVRLQCLQYLTELEIYYYYYYYYHSIPVVLFDKCYLINSLRTETTSWDWAVPSSASSLLASWGPVNLKQFNYKFGIWTKMPWSGPPGETWLSRSVSSALVWPVSAVLLVGVLCCLQVSL